MADKTLYDTLVPKMPRGWITILATQFDLSYPTVKRILQGSDDKYGIRAEALKQYNAEMELRANIKLLTNPDA